MANDQNLPNPAEAIAIPDPDALQLLVETELAGEDVPGLTILAAPDDQPLVLDSPVAVGSDAIVGGLLTLVLEDGTVIAITELDGRDYEIEPVPSDPSRVQIRFIETENPTSHIERLGDQGSGSEHAIHDVDPLVGLQINPLLPPTEYPFLPRRDFDWSGTVGSESRLTVVQIKPAIASETDGPVTIQLAEFAQVQVYEHGGETIDSVTVTVDQIPVGTTVSHGTLATAPDGTMTLTFSGDYPTYNELQITFPTDFSTASRSDISSGPLNGTVTAVSNFGSTASLTFPIRLIPEGDITLDGPGTIALTETDDVVDFRPVDALIPRATDIKNKKKKKKKKKKSPLL